jgi:hypothetical protein
MMDLDARRKLLRETHKLHLEIGILRHQFRHPLLHTLWPALSGIATLVIAGLLAVNTYVSNRATQQFQAQDLQVRWNAVLRDYVSWATDDKSETRQIAGALALGKAWNQFGTDELIGGVLASLLSSSGKGVRDAAVEAIGQAHGVPERIVSCNAAASRLLFGEAHGAPGAVGREWEKLRPTPSLAKLPRRDLICADAATFRPEELEDCRGRLALRVRALKNPGDLPDDAELRAESIRQAVHQSWACLNGANLSHFDLRHADLPEGQLQEANLEDADLCGADLRLARLTGVTAPRASFALANVAKAQMDEALKKRVVACGAVEMEKDAYRQWGEAGYPFPKSWESWRLSGYAVDLSGHPLR